MKPTRVVIVDDHAIFRQGLRKLFDEHPELSVVGEASNGTETIDIANHVAFDILLLDLHLGDMTGLKVLRRIGRNVNFQTILLGGDIGMEDEVNAILLGASGVVRKYAAFETLLRCIQYVLEGEIWVKREVMNSLVSQSRDPRFSLDNGTAQAGLTARELDIVSAVSQGLDNSEISAMLGISFFTVKHYLTRIFSKLFINNRVELALFATRNGLTGDNARRTQGSHL